MRGLAKLLPIFMLTSCLICSLIFLSCAFRSFVTDRQPASIHDIPLYPGAGDIAYSAAASIDHCSSVSFNVQDDPTSMQEFYKNKLIYDDTLIKRHWVGDGTFYPSWDPVNFYRKARGGMQVLELHMSPNGSYTHVEIQLCKKY